MKVNILLDFIDVKENEFVGSFIGYVMVRIFDLNDILVFQLDDDVNGIFVLVSGNVVNIRDLVIMWLLDYEENNEYDVVICVYGSGGVMNFEVYRI